MTMKKILQVVLALVLLAPMAAWAQQKGAIVLKSVAQVEVAEKNQKGEKSVTRIDVTKATTVPGDTVVFTTHYTNTGKRPATSVVITNPIDEHMTYIDGSAEGNNTRIEFSTDGKTYNSPDKLMVKNAQGMVRQARGEDYTGIRWTLTKPLSAGGSGSVSFKAKIK
jgi:uncharacterized repeat protein (TIGR01451 family)